MSGKRQKVLTATQNGKQWELTLECGAKTTRRATLYRPYYGSAVYGSPVTIKPKFVLCTCDKCRKEP